MENEFPSIKEQIGNLLFLIRTLFGVNKKYSLSGYRYSFFKRYLRYCQYGL